jgi:two-component SAPR family response regulator
MVHEHITRLSVEEFRQRTAGKKVVLLYPWTTYRSLFLSHFYSARNNGLLYYRITQSQSTLDQWLSGMAAEFDRVLGGFGSQLRASLTAHKPADWGEALAADLGAYRSGQVTLFVDELDRIPFDSDFQKFVTALVAGLAAHAQMAFSSRLLTYNPWYELVEGGQAVVLGTERRKDDVMYTIEGQPRPQLEIYAFGRGYALANGQYIDNWDGALPRNLFFYFVDKPLVTRREIFETFWPRLPVKEATNVFHVTKRKISERISMKIDPSQTFELTQYGGGFYTPGTKLTRHYDVSDFQIAVEKSMLSGDDLKEEQLLLEAVEYYKFPYLMETDMPWIQERREQLRQLNAQALISLGRLNKRRGNHEAALGFFTRALKHAPEREDIHREVMAIYMQLGRHDDARMQYKALAEYLHDELKINPSRETQELFNLIGL